MALFELDLSSVLLFSTIFLFLYNYFHKQSWKGLPPGPPCIPILGSLPFLGSTDIREPLHKLGKQYGEIFTVYLGVRRVIVLNSYDAIHEALHTCGDAFSHRPDIYFVTDFAKGAGVVCASGPLWKEQRRAVLRILRDFGVGKSIMEDKIHEEIQHFLDEISKNEGKVINPHLSIMYAVSNVIGSLMFGKRLDYSNEQFKHYMDILNESFEVCSSSSILTVLPALRNFPGDLFKHQKVMQLADYMDKEIQQMLDEHKKELNQVDEPRDLIDAYLREIDRLKDQETFFSEEQLVRIIEDLYGAGTETTTTTLQWALIYLLHHPNVLKRAQAEIDDVIGPERLPTMADKQKMPYVEALLCEIQRMGDIVPFSVPHATSEDINFKGYHIPKSTMVFANLYSVHRNEEYFKNPYEFDPTRFLDAEGRIRNIKQLIPFGLGRRLCLGEGLARMELFLFLSCLLQRFTPSLPKGAPLPDLKGTLCITNEPPQVEVIFTGRH